MNWSVFALGDILSLEYGAALPEKNRDVNGKVPVAGSNGIAGYHSQALVKGPGIVIANMRWIFYLLKQLKLDRLSIVTGVPGLSRNDAYCLKVPLPPLSEQHRIVEILEQADALRKKRAEADAKAERILPALFTKMFSDSVINTVKWHRVPLNKLLRKKTGALQSGPFGSNLHNSDFFEEGTVLAVGIDNVNDSGFQIGRNRRITLDKYKELEKYRLEPGDVLISIMGTIGRTCVFPEWAGKAICTKHVYRVQTELESLTPEYLSMSLRFSPTLKAQLGASTTGQIVNGITLKALKELIVDVPPLNLQKQFVQIKTLIDKKFIGCSKSRLELERLFDGLLNRAFSGDLTAKWREAHMSELLAEIEQQAKIIETTADSDYEQLALIETQQ